MTTLIRGSHTLDEDADERLVTTLATDKIERRVKPSVRPVKPYGASPPIPTDPELSPGDNIIIAGWNAGISASKIANRAGRTKNAIVGRSHRLMALGVLNPRSSPIVRTDKPGPTATPRVSGSTLPPLPSERRRMEEV